MHASHIEHVYIALLTWNIQEVNRFKRRRELLSLAYMQSVENMWVLETKIGYQKHFLKAMALQVIGIDLADLSFSPGSNRFFENHWRNLEIVWI